MRTLLALMLLLVAGTVIGAPSILRKEGECKLQVTTKAFDDEREFKVELANADVEIACIFHGMDFIGRFALSANPAVTNKSGKKLSVAYQVAFFDKEGELIACVEQESDIDPKKNATHFGSCLNRLPQAEFEKIASYRIVIYVEPVKPKHSSEQ